MKLVVDVSRTAIAWNDVHPVPSHRSRIKEVAELTGLVQVRRFVPATVVTLRSLGATSAGIVGSGSSASG
ncbi:MAG: hypothetical protein ABI862_19050, partial [Ilumatobacteraceae bacterium]